MTGPDSSLGPEGRYRLVRRIGGGGMGEVWEADDTLLGRRVALKVLAQELADDARATKRFVREARATAKLTHRNVTRVYGFGRDGGLPYLVMELLEGDTLADRLAGGPLPPAEAARIGAVVADALDAAHGRGIIHRLLDKAFSGRRAEPQSLVPTAEGVQRPTVDSIAARRCP
jgi:eukaryotic-like serine/threonine-protein kinase